MRYLMLLVLCGLLMGCEEPLTYEDMVGIGEQVTDVIKPFFDVEDMPKVIMTHTRKCASAGCAYFRLNRIYVVQKDVNSPATIGMFNNHMKRLGYSVRVLSYADHLRAVLLHEYGHLFCYQKKDTRSEACANRFMARLL